MQVGDIRKETIYNVKTGKTEVIEHVVTQKDVDCYNQQCAENEARKNQLTEDESSRLKMLDMIEILMLEVVELKGVVNNVN